MVTKKLKEIKVEVAFSDNNPDMSSLVSKAQLDKVSEMVEYAKNEGAEVVLGGNKSSRFDKGYFYEPTLLTNIKQDMQIIQEEVFGPVLPVMKFGALDEAIALANDCEFGLTSSIFSENFNKVMQASEELQFGEVYVNREHFEAIQGFHAGWKKIWYRWCGWKTRYARIPSNKGRLPLSIGKPLKKKQFNSNPKAFNPIGSLYGMFVASKFILVAFNSDKRNEAGKPMVDRGSQDLGQTEIVKK